MSIHVLKKVFYGPIEKVLVPKKEKEKKDCEAAKYRALMDDDQPIVFFKEDGVCIDANSAYLELVGADSFKQIVFRKEPEFSQRFSVFDVNSDKKITETREVKLVDQNGNVKWFLVKQKFYEGNDTKGWVCKFSEISFLKEQMFIDPLTDLFNRAYFDLMLPQYIESLNKENQENGSQRKLALIFMDLNLFKDVNDTYGHHAGDAVLKRVAKRLLAHTSKKSNDIVRPDIVCRLGGDEFVLLLDVKNMDSLNKVANKIAKAFEKPFMLKADEQDPTTHVMQYMPVKSSFGLVSYPDHVSDSNDLVRKADRAMYIAKEASHLRKEVGEPPIPIYYIPPIPSKDKSS